MTMLAESPASRGLLGALRAMGATLNELLRVRGALFGLELREEARRGKHLLGLALVGGAFLHVALMLLALLAVAAFWDTHRLEAIGAMTLLYAACGAAALQRLRAEVEDGPAPFAASRAELERDLADLRA